MIELFAAFCFKHFLCDFPLQAFPYLYKNKGIYMHSGGILHAGIHMLGTGLVLASFGVPHAAIWAVLDGVIHYHIDWTKVQITSYTGWDPLTSEWFWILLGVDQLLHYLTYVGIIYVL